LLRFQNFRQVFKSLKSRMGGGFVSPLVLTSDVFGVGWRTAGTRNMVRSEWTIFQRREADAHVAAAVKEALIGQARRRFGKEHMDRRQLIKQVADSTQYVVL
jgi:hypothetical protein